MIVPKVKYNWTLDLPPTDVAKHFWGRVDLTPPIFSWICCFGQCLEKVPQYVW